MEVFEKVYRKEYYYLSGSDRRRFLQVGFKYPLPTDPLNAEPHQLLIWSHPELLTMLRRSETRLMIDATFTCVPKGFSQCIVVMMFDEETDLFIPVVYALTDTKAQCHTGTCYIF